jgi:SAM-dependent methyltransferase
MEPINPYTEMQLRQYNDEAKAWAPDNRNPVVGSFDEHNAWEDYHLIVDGLTGVALDFGCGPGRNIVKFKGYFQRIDGVDISPVNLENAIKWISSNGIPEIGQPTPILYLCDGVSLGAIPSNSYDVVFSTIAMQHIAVHDIRLGYFKEFARVLKDSGTISIQMGIGPSPDGRSKANYYANDLSILATNGLCDVEVESPAQLDETLKNAGFKNFTYHIRPAGPGDFSHQNWIFFRAQKA